ncbi:MAG: GNAT family N-acetyltransferase [Candidatus Kapabacteria bacterium]|nr:GNAT family N-acetyltransferase [Candidatus Kapabacteria bacterium]
MKFQVLRLTNTDTSFIQSLIDDFLTCEESPTINHLANALQDDRTYLYVAKTDEQIVAYCLGYKFPSIYSAHYLAYLYDIEVLQEFRKNGIGKALISELKEQLTKDNVNELWLGTSTDNISGQALFSKTGAEKSNETFNDYTYELSGSCATG